MTLRRTVVSLVAALVVASMFASGAALTVGAQQDDGAGEPTGLVVESLEAPGAVAPNSTLTVTATVENPTAQAVTEDVAYRFEGGAQDVVLTERVTVEPDGNRTVEFTLETTDFGTGEFIHGVTTANSSEFTTIDVTRDALVDFDEQETDGTSVVVDSVFVPEGGYLTIHDATLLEGDALGSVVGVSAHLGAGYHENVTVELFDVEGAEFDRGELTESQLLIAMPHQETNNNTTYDFVSTEGAEDGPYTVDGEPVTENAAVTVPGDGDPTGGADENGEGDSTGATESADDALGNATDANESTGANESDGDATGDGLVGDDNATDGNETEEDGTPEGDGDGTDEATGDDGDGTDGTNGDESDGTDEANGNGTDGDDAPALDPVATN